MPERQLEEKEEEKTSYRNKMTEHNKRKMMYVEGTVGSGKGLVRKW